VQNPTRSETSQMTALGDPRVPHRSLAQIAPRGASESGATEISRTFPPSPLLGIAEIADGLGMSRSTVHRYITTLHALGYLEQDASRKYRLGLRVTDLGMSALNSTGLREHAHPDLEALRQRTSYPTNLGVLDGTDVIYVDRVAGFCGGATDSELKIGSRLPAYATAVGKVLLAGLPEGERRPRISQMKLTKRGPNTITSKKALHDELEEIRAEGFAVGDEEFAGGLYAIAAAVRNDAREVVAAVSLVAPNAMISLAELVDKLGPHLISTADRISARLGYRRDDEQG
jgi:IclR family transcriptional regulator, pca regulon regulatory protein